jgi:hypothetical protein
MARQIKLTLKSFVEKGYFPPELIPPFTSKELGKHINSIYPSLTGMNININGKETWGRFLCSPNFNQLINRVNNGVKFPIINDL